MRLLKDEPYHGLAMIVESPLGSLGLLENGQALTHLFLNGNELPAGSEITSTPLLEEAARQLAEYFDGRRRVFDLPLNPFGTDFQRRVWAEIIDIPYGQTITYGEIAEAVGRPGASRAVGQASNRNPIAIIIPCHRVIGRDGGLTGYGGGLEAKDYLLRLEDDIVCGRLRNCPDD